MFRPEDIEDLYPLTPMQQGILFHSLRSRTAGLYFEQLVWKLEQSLAPELFRAAWQRVVDRHTILRTSFLWEEVDEPIQVVHRRAEVELREHDWRGLAGPEVEQRLAALLAAERRQGFDLTVPPLVRLTLIRTGGESYRFVWSHHHLLLDGWSYPVLLQEVIACYTAFLAGREPVLGRPRPFRDFIAYLQSRDLDEAERYWRAALAGLTGPTPLGVDRLTPETLAGEELYARAELQLSPAATAELQRLAARHQVTQNALVQAAWALLLARYSGESDVVFGVIVSSRPPALAGSESMVGLFLNNVPLRVGVDPAAELASWLREVHARQFEVFQYEFCGLQKILEWSGLPRGRALFESYLTFQNYPSGDFYREHGGGLVLRDLDFAIRTGFPLTVVAGFVPLFGVAITYDRRRFDAATCGRMLGHLQAIFESWITRPDSTLGEVSLLRPAERHQILAEWNDTRGEIPAPAVLHAWIAAQAACTPGRVAVETEDEALTYGELDRRSGQLAALLARRGVGRGSVVGIYLERSAGLMVALLAVLKAGGAYLPLDLEYPAERIAYMLEDAGARVAIALESHAGRLPETVHTVRLDADAGIIAAVSPPVPVEGDDLAYLIYTSGSTGRPKGAMNTHRAVVNRLVWMQETYRLTADDRILQKTPISFDVSVWELFWPLMAGARLVFARPEGHRDSAYLVRLVRERGVTVMHFVPSMLHPFLAEPGVGTCTGLRQVIASGEALSHDLQELFFKRLPGAALDNLYGPTEAAIDVSFWACDRGSRQRSVPIGRPITNLGLHVLDGDLAPAPIGVPGELYIGGVGLARGYLARPDLTAERFLPDPFAGEPGGRLYRTGDRVRRLPDGNLEYLERIDHQVKIRGFRIELGEIEAGLRAHPEIAEAAVVAREDASGDRGLVAYAVPAGSGQAPTVNELRRFLARTLPDYMVPAAFVFLSALPLTTSGKVDRQALPAPDADRPELEEAYEAPRTSVERDLAALWSEVLGIGRIGVHDNFFALGGDSMKSLRVLAKAREKGFELTLDLLLARPTVEALAQEIAAGVEAVPSGAAGAPFSLLGEEERQRLPADVEDAYPLTRLQAGMLFYGDYGPGTSAYHDVFSYRFAAPFDAAALGSALRGLVARHPVLRTSFDLSGPGEPLQRVHRDCEVPVFCEDWRGLDPAGAERALDAWILEERHRGFTWDQPPLFRVRVDVVGERAFLFTLSFHHAILDGWSVATLVQELGRAYGSALRGEAGPGEPPPRTSFRDYVALERAAIESASDRELWVARLAGAPDPRLPRLPGAGEEATRDRRRPVLDLSSALAPLREVARRAGTPLKSVLLAAHLRVLSLLAGGSEVVTGLVLNNRPETADGERVLGVLLSVLPLRLELGHGSWLELARQAFEAERELIPHRRFPLAEMVRLTGRSTLFAGVFNFTHFYGVEEDGGEPMVSGRRFFEETSFPLVANFNLDAQGSRLALSLEIDPAELTSGQAAAVEGYYTRALAAIAADPLAPTGAVSLLSPAELQELLTDWNATRSDFPREASLQELFEARAAASPTAMAVVYGDRSLDYRTLNERANRLAHHLLALGCEPETPVGIFLERSAELVVAILAVIKAGGAYVPLDLDYPQERLAFMLGDARVPLVISQPALAERLPETAARRVLLDADAPAIDRRAGTDPPRRASGDHLAYVMYTSGSTGRPKGVAVIQRAVARLVLGADYVQLGPADRVGQASNIAFDVLTFEIWGALLNGGCLVGLTREELLSPALLVAALRRQGISALFLTAALFHQVVREVPDAFRTLRAFFFGGDVADPARVREVLAAAPPSLLLNGYGPTECTTFAVCHRVLELPAELETVPIGRPIANTTAYIVDGDFRPVPVAVPGELLLGGDGLARGYFDRPGLTASRFIPDPFGSPGGRLYRTGDLARWLPDGVIEFLGRLDYQVKVRGYRIELGEIESNLTRHPEVAEAVVLARSGDAGSKQLVAYVVPARRPAPGAELVTALRQHLREKLPDYMIPAAFVVLEALPLTANGKVDRRALPEPDRERTELAAGFVPPRTPAEQRLAAVWQDVLRVERVGVEDNFFELGGDSILSIQIVARAREAGLRVTPRQIFEEQTVAGLALVAEEITGETPGDTGPVTGEAPLTPVQHWFFDQGWSEPHHFNQSLVLAPRERLDPGLLDRAWREILAYHDALRLTYAQEKEGWRQVHAAPGGSPFAHVDLAGLPAAARATALAGGWERLQSGFDLARGPLIHATLFEMGGGEQRLHLAAHHLVVDWVSWRVILEDMERLYGQARRGEPLRLPPKTTSFQRFADLLASQARTAGILAETAHWTGLAEAPGALPPAAAPAGENTVVSTDLVIVHLEEALTRALLTEVPPVYNTGINDVLLAALVEAVVRWTGEPALLLDLEGHGREEILPGVDLSRTVGWFTSIFPVFLEIRDRRPGEALKAVKEQLRRTPRQGLGFGLLRYLADAPAVARRLGAIRPEVGFNYLGQLDTALSTPLLQATGEAGGLPQSPRGARPHRLEVVGAVFGGRLEMTFAFSRNLDRKSGIEVLARGFLAALEGLIHHCLSPEAGGYTPSDFPDVALSEEQLDRVLAELELSTLED